VLLRNINLRLKIHANVLLRADGNSSNAVDQSNLENVFATILKSSPGSKG